MVSDPEPISGNIAHLFQAVCNSDHSPVIRVCKLSPTSRNVEELRDPRSFVPRMAQRPCCAISSFFGEYLDMTTSEPFTPRTPDPDKAPRPPTHHQPPQKPAKPILVPSKRKAAFQWPPDCLWPFDESIGHIGWDSDA